MKDLLVILGILFLCFKLDRLFRGNRIRHFLKKKKGAAQHRKPIVMKPKSERECPFCVKEKGRLGSSKAEMPTAWSSRKGRGVPTKKISTQDHSCPISDCEYFGITDESIHAMVGYASQGCRVKVETLDGKGVIELSFAVIEGLARGKMGINPWTRTDSWASLAPGQAV